MFILSQIMFVTIEDHSKRTVKDQKDSEEEMHINDTGISHHVTLNKAVNP